MPDIWNRLKSLDEREALMVPARCGKAFAIGLMLVVSGCSSATDPNRPKTAVVNGSVTYQGKPVANAGVTFAPQSHEHTAIGRTDADGNFQLRTFEPNDGAVPGDFKVTVVKFEAPKAPEKELSDEELERRESKSEPPPPKSLVPEKYGSPKTSKLSVKVVEGTNEVKLELKD